MNHNICLDLIEESGIRKYRNIAKQKGMIDFTIGDTCIDLSDKVKGGIIQELIDNHTHYEMTQGDLSVRELISKKENGLSFAPSEVLLTIGATEGIYVALTALINPGDEVILFKPYYSLYKNVVIQNGAKIKEVDLLHEIDIKGVISENTKTIVFNTPNNPTGLLHLDVMDKIIDIVQKKDIYVIIDATYDEIIYEKRSIDYSKWKVIRDKLIIVKSLSKSHAMTGLRLGYVLANSSIMKYLVMVHQMCISCIPSIYRKAYLEALNEDIKGNLIQYEAKRNYLISKLSEMNIEYIRPEGAFYVCLYVPSNKSSTEYTHELIEYAKIVCVPGIYFGDDRIVRLSFSTKWDNLISGMNQLRDYMDNKFK